MDCEIGAREARSRASQPRGGGVEAAEGACQVSVDHQLRRIALRLRRVVAQVFGGAEAARHDECIKVGRLEFAERRDLSAADARRLRHDIAGRVALFRGLAGQVIHRVKRGLVGCEAGRGRAGGGEVHKRRDCLGDLASVVHAAAREDDRDPRRRCRREQCTPTGSESRAQDPLTVARQHSFCALLDDTL